MAKIEKAGTLTITSGIYENRSGESSGYSVIDNDSLLYINEGNIRTFNTHVRAIFNGKKTNAGYIEVNGGKINTGYAQDLYNAETALVKLKGGIFNRTYSGAYGSSRWDYSAILNRGYMYLLDDSIYVSGYNGVFNEEGYLEIKKGSISTYNAAVIDSTRGRIVIDGGYLGCDSDATIVNQSNGTITIKNATITRGSYGVMSESNGTIVIDNIDLSAKSDGSAKFTYGIYATYNYTGKIIINNGDICGNYQAVRMSRHGSIVINGGTFKNTYDNEACIKIGADYSDSTANMTINGGHIIGRKYGIYVRWVYRS